MKVYGLAKDINIPNEPDRVFGSYMMTHAQAAVGVGGGAYTAVALHRGVTLNLSLQMTTGFGLNVGLSTLKIENADTKSKTPSFPTYCQASWITILCSWLFAFLSFSRLVSNFLELWSISWIDRVCEIGLFAQVCHLRSHLCQ